MNGAAPVDSAQKVAGGLFGSLTIERILKAFCYRDFRVLWLGSFTSSIGTWMQSVAENWLVFSLTSSAFFLGLDAFLQQIPILLFSLFSGVIADRMDRRKMLLTSQYVQMSCAVVLAVLVYLKLVQVWQILLLSFISGSAQAFGAPASQALVPTLVEKEGSVIGAGLMVTLATMTSLIQLLAPDALRGHVTSIYTVAFRGSMSLGSLLAGYLASRTGPSLVFACNGIALVLVAIFFFWRGDELRQADLATAIEP